MQFSVSRSPVTEEKTACAIVAVHATRLSEEAQILDKLYNGHLSQALKSGDLASKRGATLSLFMPKASRHKRVLLVQIGKDKSLSIVAFKSLMQSVAKAVHASNASSALNLLLSLDVDDSSPRAIARLQSTIFSDSVYKYSETFSKQKPPSVLKRITLNCPDTATSRQVQIGCAQGKAIASGMAITKNLGDLPANICTPSHLAEVAKNLKTSSKRLSVQVLGEPAMEKLGMGSLLSVSAGSAEEAKLIAVQYKGAAASKKPIVLIGKGITFDTGGISLKAGAGMDEMKFDMCGAATVLGVMQTLAELDLPINVVGIVAAAENMPGSKATKPGDVVTSMSGQTIEILNTDAEGRLVLCDALTYAARFKPDVVIDMATLTGACIVALGFEACGLMSNSDKLSEDLLASGQASADRAWRLPIWDEYQPSLDSNFADMANIGNGRWAGAITAGCFLQRFAKDYQWAHLDIAGVAWNMGKNKGATARPVALLSEYLLRRAKQA